MLYVLERYATSQSTYSSLGVPSCARRVQNQQWLIDSKIRQAQQSNRNMDLPGLQPYAAECEWEVNR